MTYSKGVVEVQDFVPFTCKGTRSLAVTNLVTDNGIEPLVRPEVAVNGGRAHLVALASRNPLSVTTNLGIINSRGSQCLSCLPHSLLIPTLFCSHTHRDLPSLCLSCLGRGKDVPADRIMGCSPQMGAVLDEASTEGVPTSGLCLVRTDPLSVSPNGVPAEPEVAVAKTAPLGVVVARWLSGVVLSLEHEGIATKYRSLLVSLVSMVADPWSREARVLICPPAKQGNRQRLHRPSSAIPSFSISIRSNQE